MHLLCVNLRVIAGILSIMCLVLDSCCWFVSAWIKLLFCGFNLKQNLVVPQRLLASLDYYLVL